MKTKFISLSIFVLSLAGCSENIKPVSEIPSNIIATKPCSTLYSRIYELFPESKNQLRSRLFADTLQKNIVLTQDADVYLTFISQGAGLANSFGWYSYNILIIPQKSSDFTWHVLFPNVSSKLLKTGDRLKLQDKKFTKGTVVGFFLITRGWENGAIDYSKLTHFTDFLLNQNQLQQHFLFEEKLCGDIVLTFEDLPLNQIDCDHDFNDIVFTISDNNKDLTNTSFEQTRMIKL